MNEDVIYYSIVDIKCAVYNSLMKIDIFNSTTEEQIKCLKEIRNLMNNVRWDLIENE